MLDAQYIKRLQGGFLIAYILLALWLLMWYMGFFN